MMITARQRLPLMKGTVTGKKTTKMFQCENAWDCRCMICIPF